MNVILPYKSIVPMNILLFQSVFLLDMAFLYDKNTWLAYLLLFVSALIGTGYNAINAIDKEIWTDGYTRKFWRALISSLFISLLVLGVVIHYEMTFIPGLLLTLILAAEPDRVKLLMQTAFQFIMPKNIQKDEDITVSDGEPNDK